jgi:hypothetical protein
MKMNAVFILFMIAISLFGIWSVIGGTFQVSAETPKSLPGEYSGFSKAMFDGYKISSLYVPVRDGNRLAAR